MVLIIIHLLKNGKPDLEVIELMAKAGFTDFSFPFESGNGRILKKWSSNKWDINNTDVKGLIEALKKNNIRMDANYIIGFPDETYEEVMNTIKFAKQNAEWGVDTSCFFICMPLPGTSMYDYCMENGLLDKDFNIDKMNWRKANMINTPVSPEDLESIRDKAWEEVNSDEWKKNRRKLIVANPE